MAKTTSQLSVCARIAERLALQVGSHRYGMWFDRTARLAYSDAERRLHVSVPNRFVADWIGKNFIRDLEQAAASELGEGVNLCLDVAPDQFRDLAGPVLPPRGAAPAPFPAFPAHAAAGRIPGRGMAPPCLPAVGAAANRPPSAPAAGDPQQRGIRYRLDDFVLGPSNELAAAAALRLADEDFDSAGAANPLFIHGGCGLGKTHLLQGICARHLDRKPGARVLYITGERFTNEFLAALRAKQLDAWRKRIRRLELLAIDDVHFLAHTNKTQQEFMHCFDAIEMNGGRVVMAAGRHPKAIPDLTPALASRCLRGLVVELAAPNTETRVKMVKALAERRGISLLETVVSLLASRCSGGVREIEGTITKLSALAALMPPARLAAIAEQEIAPFPGAREETGGAGGRPAADGPDIPSMARAGDGGRGQRVIGHTVVNQLLKMERQHRPAKVIEFKTVLDVVMEVFKVQRDQLMSRSRKLEVVMARSIMIYLARQLTPLSFPEIAAAMGRTSHSTVVTAANRVERQLAARKGETIALPPEDDGSQKRLTLPELVARLRQEIERR